MTPIVQNINDVDFVASLTRRYGTGVLSELLKDRTTKNNIIWADREYVELGTGYAPYDEITIAKISDRRVIEPRVVKSIDQQAWRTKESAEVFTPSWLCKQMVDCMDDAFFGEAPAAFEDGAETGLTDNRLQKLGESELWKAYVDNRLLEITCGEAPFVCSPYDATTGDFVPVDERIGFLDRKLRVVKRFAESYEDWLAWAKRALESSYGYEYQGDNLLIARINTFNTFADYLQDAWGKELEEEDAKYVARVISWNLWQMDGLRDCVPSKWDIPEAEDPQMSMFDLEGFWVVEETETKPWSVQDEQEQSGVAQLCEIKDWRSGKKQTFASLKG